MKENEGEERKGLSLPDQLHHFTSEAHKEFEFILEFLDSGKISHSTQAIATLTQIEIRKNELQARYKELEQRGITAIESMMG